MRIAYQRLQDERNQVDDIRGTPMSVGNLEEMIDDSHAIVSSSVGPEYYVTIMSFVDRDLLEPGCSVLMHNKVLFPFFFFFFWVKLTLFERLSPLWVFSPTMLIPWSV